MKTLIKLELKMNCIQEPMFECTNEKKKKPLRNIGNTLLLDML